MQPDPRPLTASDDALPAMTSLTSWVGNADTKIGILTGGLVLLTGSYVRQRRPVETVLNALEPLGVVALVLLALGVLALACAIGHVLVALRPRLAPGDRSRFSFPHLAEADLDELMAGDAIQVRREAWSQARTLARIVRAKYQSFRRALSCTVISSLLLGAWVILTST
jgi:hypothetical protein